MPTVDLLTKSTIATVPSPEPHVGFSFTVQPGDGDKFPDPVADGAYNVILQDALNSSLSHWSEVVRVVGKSGDTFTVLRGQQGYSNRFVHVGDVVYMAPSDSTLVLTSTRNLHIAITGSGAIPTGVFGEATLSFDCLITGWVLLADIPGNIQLDIWKTTYAAYPPTVADTITASSKPILSSAIKAADTLLTGWNTTINAGDTFRFNVDSSSVVSRVLLVLALEAT